jgi:hypothetical protein
MQELWHNIVLGFGIGIGLVVAQAVLQWAAGMIGSRAK